LAEETEKGGRRKSQNRYILPPRGGANSQPICTKFGEFVHLTNVITPVKFGCKILIGFPRPGGGKSIFPLETNGLYITVPRATAMACDYLLNTKIYKIILVLSHSGQVKTQVIKIILFRQS